MKNKYLSYDRERAPKVKEMFTRLAWRYDVVNDVMSFGLHRRWKRQTVAIAAEGIRKGGRWLDLCCGTGDMCFLAEGAGGAETRVVGADFTLPMLAVARRRKLAQKKSSAFAQADALRLPFSDGTFDAITVGYGLRNLAEPEAGLAEMRRVLAPGGRAVILDFGKPGNPVAAAGYQAFLHTMMPAVGLIFHGDADTYLYIPASLKRYPGQRGVAELMRQTGFVNVRFEERLLGTMGINIGEAPESRVPSSESRL
ncbi:MAG TPA: bifunctional demethylmenaquinone methyltransferase/2-methoxy-6-polyprenyl-1,4-benzoquinol methylase UbiE [Thermoanaerobaculia bacterium]|nr:bifunctional demethylmenaquinone methyltransferase/2-methoxy-6-polyprenyl-1,4-benzoquinol methylase UbiE [Thermoanaerobaculia bacterium]